MELIIKDIKESLSCCSPKELEDRITLWRNQFRHEGISIITLETLLNFYQDPYAKENIQPEDDYINIHSALYESDSDDNQQTIRLEIDKLKKENKELQKRIKKWRKYSILISLFAIAVTFLICLLFLLIK